MANFSEVSTSKYLKKEDLKKPRRATITNFKKENLAMSGQNPNLKFVLYFQQGDIKPFVCNQTNAQRIIHGFGFPDDKLERWIGKQIILDVDPTIMFQGKMTGGVVVRMPKSQITTSTVNVPEPDPSITEEPDPVDDTDCATETGDDIPF